MLDKKINGLPSPATLAAARCSEGASEARANGVGPQPKSAPNPLPAPNPEVVAKAKRRQFTGEYKRRILIEADAMKATGGLGALLRREHLYSSLLVTWRRERDAGIVEGLTPAKRGPKSKQNSLDVEVSQLRRQNARLTEDLRKAAIVIDVQKNWRRCWRALPVKRRRRRTHERRCPLGLHGGSPIRMCGARRGSRPHAWVR